MDKKSSEAALEVQQSAAECRLPCALPAELRSIGNMTASIRSATLYTGQSGERSLPTQSIRASRRNIPSCCL